MRQSVELLLDGRLTAEVRGEWDAITAAGLPGLSLHSGPTNAPHVTLVVADTVTAGAERALPHAVVDLPVALRLGGLAVFGAPRRRVLARLVVPSVALLTLHAHVWGAMEGCPRRTELTSPGRWTPHVTLAHRLDDAGVAGALAVLGTVAALDGEAPLARRWDPVARRAWAVAPTAGLGPSDPVAMGGYSRTEAEGGPAA